MKKAETKQFYCTCTLCTTPKCPFRIAKGKTPPPDAEDLSATCQYYASQGDGRWLPHPVPNH